MLNKLQAVRKNANKKGFTLVELIVVIIIIAIIAAIALPRLAAFQDDARKTRINAEHRQLVTAIQMHIGKAKDPKTAVDDLAGQGGLEKLKPYMNTKGSDSLADTLAQNNGSVAHVINANDKKLVSTFTPSNGGQGETWEYNFTVVSN